MSMRDLIPWGRQENRLVPSYGDEVPRGLLGMGREIERLLDDLWRGPLAGSGVAAATAWPRLEVHESADEVRINAELPGMNEKDVELSVADGVLTIRGEKKSETEDPKRGWSERFYGRFERRIALPDGTKEDQCTAEFRDGVLNITIPKSEEARRSRRIPINQGTRH